VNISAAVKPIAIETVAIGKSDIVRSALGKIAKPVTVSKLLTLIVAVVIAWSLKQHYAEARADDLRWMLRPTAHLVGAATGATFVMQPGEGYFARERLFLIEKSCAGINFMIAAFAMLIVALVHRARSASSAARVLGASLAISYVAAVAVNTTRITIAMWLGAHPAALSGFSAGEVHRIEGITVYFVGLVLLYELVQRLERRVPRYQEVM
jgi:exosortase K